MVVFAPLVHHHCSASFRLSVAVSDDAARMSFESPPSGLFEDVNMDALGMDEAYLRVYNDDDSPNESAYLYGRSDNCDKCPFESYGVVGTYYVCKVCLISPGTDLPGE